VKLLKPLPAIIAAEVYCYVATCIEKCITLTFGGIIVYCPAVCAGVGDTIYCATNSAELINFTLPDNGAV